MNIYVRPIKILGPMIRYAAYLERKHALASKTEGPSATDQAGADDTDINVIVKRYGVYGTVPSGMKTPQFGVDMTGIPTDLAEVIEAARSLQRLRGELPVELATSTIEELLAYTPEEISAKLTPAPTPTPEEAK